MAEPKVVPIEPKIEKAEKATAVLTKGQGTYTPILLRSLMRPDYDVIVSRNRILTRFFFFYKMKRYP